jgi:putative spermidine/putrescine transport system substrate-binding protein
MSLRVLLVAGFAVIFALPAYSRDLTVALLGATQNDRNSADILRHALLTPFSAASLIPLQQVTWPGSPDALHPTPPDPLPWDIVEIPEADLRPACEQGLLEKLDWNAIGGRDHYLPIAVSDCGVGAYVHSLVLAWNPQKYPGQATWVDFWDVARVPGKRGLAHQARDNLEIALLADGVGPTDVYAALRTTEGVNRAFRKLDQLRPYLVWWGPQTPPTRLLESGDVLMSSVPSTLAAPALRNPAHPLVVQWAGSLYRLLDWAVAKGSPHLAEANKFLLFAADPAQQVALLPLGSVAKVPTDHLAPEQLALTPSANLPASLHVDPTFWHDNAATLEARFAEWLAH